MEKFAFTVSPYNLKVLMLIVSKAIYIDTIPKVKQICLQFLSSPPEISSSILLEGKVYNKKHLLPC